MVGRGPESAGFSPLFFSAYASEEDPRRDRTSGDWSAAEPGRNEHFLRLCTAWVTFLGHVLGIEPGRGTNPAEQES